MKLPWQKSTNDAPDAEEVPPLVTRVDSTAGIIGALNPSSSTWVFIRDHVAEALRIDRERNDCPLDEKQTATLRGRIEFAKEILDLPGRLKSGKYKI